ncbi:MAG TPA: C1 family peptidase [Spirochaetota bacterium]|nr:C1 family peptidase [Spirochaetota bacterium]HPQ53814.1 C1 family peptidase [Spirochaetota bacterium]
MKIFKASFVAGIALLSIFFMLQDSHAQSSIRDNMRKQLEMQRQQDSQAVEKAREQLRDIQKMIREKHLSFRAEMTEALKQRIQDITGLKAPSRLSSSAKRQTINGEKALSRFVKKRKGSGNRNVKGGFMSLSEDEDLWYKPAEEMNFDDIYDLPVDDDIYSRRESDNIYNRRPQRREEKKVEPKREERTPERKQPKRTQPDRQSSDSQDLAYLANPTLAAFNWKDKNRVTPIRHQQTCGSCWAFTTVSLLEASYKIQQNKDYDFSEQQIVDCARGNNGQRAGSCNGGWYGNAFESLQRRGAWLEEKAKYKNRDYTCPGFEPTPYKVVSWGYIRPDGGTPTVAEMKKALTKYGPIATTVKVTPPFQAYAGGVFDEHTRLNAPNDVNHAVVLVGWDDSKGRHGSWLLRNSWGTQWGEQGYMWIEYGCNGVGYGAAWAVADVQ